MCSKPSLMSSVNPLFLRASRLLPRSGNQIEIGDQKDVGEFCMNFFNRLEEGMQQEEPALETDPLRSHNDMETDPPHAEPSVVEVSTLYPEEEEEEKITGRDPPSLVKRSSSKRAKNLMKDTFFGVMVEK